MKRCISILLMITICMTLIACSNQPTTHPTTPESEIELSDAAVVTSDKEENEERDDNTVAPTDDIPDISSPSSATASSETTSTAEKEETDEVPSVSEQPTAPPKETESTTPKDKTEAEKPAESPKEKEPEKTEPEETTQPTPSEQPKNATANDCKAIANMMIEKINSYRSGSAIRLSGLTEYAEYRSRQIVSNFAHDTADQRTAATALQYGDYVDPPLYGMTGDPYYTVNAREAIAMAGYYGSVDYVAEQLTQQFKNSESHWSYISDMKYQYIAVGVTYQSGTWYCAVVLTQTNTDNN